ncbi:MAG: TIM barrel protein [Gammaproteobacteria bacterium]|nr:TIM barrel protein [Gammaproteobacteria bacterium]
MFQNIKIDIAGWPLRDLTLDELNGLFTSGHIQSTEGALELAKDFVESRSIKKLAAVIGQYDFNVLSFAGTTDFCNMSGMGERDYFRYLKIQFAEAAFLNCNMFRALVGEAGQALSNAALIYRLNQAQDMLGNIELVFETHGGRETELETLCAILDHTSFRYVVDISNIGQSESVQYFMENDLSDRIAYFHIRNWGRHVEDDVSLAWEQELMKKYPNQRFMFEPKMIAGTDALNIIKS